MRYVMTKSLAGWWSPRQACCSVGVGGRGLMTRCVTDNSETVFKTMMRNNAVITSKGFVTMRPLLNEVMTNVIMSRRR